MEHSVRGFSMRLARAGEAAPLGTSASVIGGSPSLLKRCDSSDSEVSTHAGESARYYKVQTFASGCGRPRVARLDRAFTAQNDKTRRMSAPDVRHDRTVVDLKALLRRRHSVAGILEGGAVVDLAGGAGAAAREKPAFGDGSDDSDEGDYAASGSSSESDQDKPFASFLTRLRQTGKHGAARGSDLCGWLAERSKHRNRAVLLGANSVSRLATLNVESDSEDEGRDDEGEAGSDNQRGHTKCYNDDSDSEEEEEEAWAWPCALNRSFKPPSDLLQRRPNFSSLDLRVVHPRLFESQTVKRAAKHLIGRRCSAPAWLG